MILPLALLCGACAALLRAIYNRHPPVVPSLSSPWLVLIAFVPQYVIFFLPATRHLFPTPIVSVILISSLIVLAMFAWLNRNQSGFKLLAGGLLLNLLVIVANGGLMPISPQTIERLSLPATYVDNMVQIGERFGYSKDIVLPLETTKLWWLSDIFLMPRWLIRWLPLDSAFSLGDILIAVGGILFFWQTGAASQDQNPLRHNHYQAIPRQ